MNISNLFIDENDETLELRNQPKSYWGVNWELNQNSQ